MYGLLRSLLVVALAFTFITSTADARRRRERMTDFPVPKCPAGIGAEKGESPKVWYLHTSRGRSVIACGKQDALLPGGWHRMTEFEIVASGFSRRPKVLHRAEKNEYYNVFSNVDAGMVLERLARLPLQDGETYVPVERVHIKCTYRGCHKKGAECVLPALSKKLHPDIVEKVRSGDYPENAAGKLLVRALTGDQEAAGLLEQLGTATAVATPTVSEEAKLHQDVLKSARGAGCGAG